MGAVWARSSELLLRLLVAAAVFLAALDGGSFSGQSRLALAIALWWTIGLAVALGLAPRADVPRAALAALALAGAFAAWTGLSMAWAAADELAFAEFDRVALYAAVVTLVVLAARRGSAPGWADGLALGLVGVALLALASRCFPDAFGEPEIASFLPGAGEVRLSYPVNYWNGLAILCALAVPLLLRLAVASENRVLAALAVAPLPAIAAVVYLASSRGGALTAIVGASAFVALTERRYGALAALLAGGAGAAAFVTLADRWPELVDDPLVPAAVSQGREAALVLVLCCLGAGSLYGLARLLPLRSPPRAAGYALLAAVVVALAAAAVAADLGKRFDAFKSAPQPGGANDVESHLVSVGSSGRWQHWHAAVDQFREAPLVGDGAGSYAAWWAEHGVIRGFVSEAHSLYLETLGELGLVGLVLVGALFVLALAVGVSRSLASDGPERVTAAALTAGFAAYAVAAGIDWMWELTVVSLVGMALLGLLVGPATLRSVERAHRVPRAARVGVPAVALVLVVAAALPLLKGAALRESQREAERGRTSEAIAAARDARALEPWAASPPLQLALLYEASGDVEAARWWVGQAIERDARDWRIRLAAARIATRAGDVAEAQSQLSRARELNPRSPLLAGLAG
jgi:tetratricopeptide (TPR) repeat protein